MPITVPKFEFVPNWKKKAPPHGVMSDTAVDSEDRIYAFARPSSATSDDGAVLVFSPDGEFLNTWGRGLFVGTRPHRITITPDDFVYLVEDLGCRVRKFTLDGKELAVIGPSGEENRSDTGCDWSVKDSYERLDMITGGPPYNHPTHLEVGPNGDLYVSDGYGNCKVHRFSSDGEFKQSWGQPGTGPGEFHLVHSVFIPPDGRVYVCDRFNDRIQVFTLDGEFIEQWTDMRRPNCIVFRDGLFYVGESAMPAGERSFVHGTATSDKPRRIGIFDSKGNLVGEHAKGTNYTHSVSMDSRGNLYAAGEGDPGIVKYARV